MSRGEREVEQYRERAIDRLTEEERFDRLLDDEEEFRRDVQQLRDHEMKQGSVADGVVTDAKYDPERSRVTIIITAPDATDHAFTIRVGNEELSESAKALIDCLGTDRLADSVGRTVPIVYTDEGWELHLPMRFGPKYRWFRFGLDKGIYRYSEDVSHSAFSSRGGVAPTKLGFVVFLLFFALWVGAGMAVNPFIAATSPIAIVIYPFWERLRTVGADDNR